MVIRANGSDRHAVFRCRPQGSECTAQHLPAWSPDGQRIAFTREGDPLDDGPRLWVMDADGSNLSQVAEAAPRFSEFGPAWSPDGKRLVFERFDEKQQLSAVHGASTGGDYRRLTPWRMDAGEPMDWSPDGRWILFLDHSWSDVPSSLWAVRPHGGDRHRIAGTSGDTFTWLSGSFSPDGSRITAAGRSWDDGLADVYVLSIHGRVLRNITATKGKWESFADLGAS